MGSLATIIMLLRIAAEAEPIIAAVASTLIPALKKLHETHSDAILLADLTKLFHAHGLPDAAKTALQLGPVPEGHTQAQP
jgi:hypothetical protein